MKLTAHKTSDLSTAKTNKIKDFIVACFPENPELSKTVYTHPGLSTCVLIHNNGSIIAHGNLVDRVVPYKGKKYLIAGAGNICVSSGLRGKGIGSMVLNALNKIIKKENYHLGMLFCHPKLHDFYAGTGWIKKEMGKIYYCENGEEKYERTTYLLPVNLKNADLHAWLQKNINVGEGTW